MDAAIQAVLTAGGVNVKETVARFSGNEALFLRFLRRFPGDPSFAVLRQSLLDGRRAQAADACHTLKGVSGNLGLSQLYAACVDLMAVFRQSDAADTGATFDEVCAAYESAVELVRRIGD